jgi:hypothetical protein
LEKYRSLVLGFLRRDGTDIWRLERGLKGFPQVLIRELSGV